MFHILVLMLAINVSYVSAVEPTAKIVPTEGSVYTDIFLQIRGLEKFLEGDNWPGYRDMEMYLYWDDKPLILGLSDLGSGDKNMHYFDVHFSAPNEHPYSDLGNHTIYIEIYKDWAAFLCNFTLTFEIVEYLPCDEYLALNATYSELLSNYTNLLDNYNSLVANYSTLNDDFTSLSANYEGLFGSYDGLNSTYYNLQRNYDSLSSSYDTLEASYSALIEEMSSARNLSYVFITTTIILAATAIYLALRRTRAQLV